MNKLIKSVVFLAACSLVFAGCEKKNKKGKGSSSSGEEQSVVPYTPSGDQGGGGGDSGGGGGGGDTPVTPTLLDDVVTITVDDKVYDGASIGVVAAATSGRTPTVTFSIQNDSSEPFSTAPKNVGNYVVCASLPEDETYKAASSEKNFSITQKEVGLVWAPPASLVYDEQAKVPTVTATGVVTGDTVNVMSELKEGEDNINVGTFHFEATSLDNSNYKLPENKVSDAFEITKATRPAQIIHLGNIEYKAGLDLSCSEFTLPEGYEWNLETAPGLVEINDLGKYTFNITRIGGSNYFDTHTTVDFTIVRGDPTLRAGYVPIQLAAYYGDPLSTALMGYEAEYIAGWAFEDDPDQPIRKISVGDNHPTYKMSYNCGDPHYYTKEHIDIVVEVAKSDSNAISFTAEDKVYDGEPYEPVAPTLEEDADVSYEYFMQSDTEHQSPLAGAPINVGDYTVVALSEATDHYNTCAIDADFSITQGVGEISFKDEFVTEYATVQAFKDVNMWEMVNYNGTINNTNVRFRYSTTYNFLAWDESKPTAEGVWYIKAIGQDSNLTSCNAITQIYIGSAKQAYDLEKLVWSNIGSFNKNYDGDSCGAPTLVYDGVAVAAGDMTVHYQRAGESAWNLYSDDVVNAGEYTFRFILAETENLHATAVHIDIEISKVDPRNLVSLSHYETPDYWDVYYGLPLSELVSNDGYLQKTGGKWYFEEPLDNLVGPVGTQTHQMHYEPDDDVNFLTVGPIGIDIDVRKATPEEAKPKNLTAPINTQLKNIPLPEEFAWYKPNNTIANNTLGASNYEAICNPSDNIQCAANTHVNIRVVGTAGLRNAHMWTKNAESWDSPISIVYDGSPITYIVEPNHGHSQAALNNYDLAITYGPYETAPYLVEFKQVGQSDVMYETTPPTEVGNYVMRLTVEASGKYLGIVYEKEFSIIPREPEYRYVDRAEGKTYQFYSETVTPWQTMGHVDVFPFTDKSSAELREYNPEVAYMWFEYKEYDDFLDTKLLSCVDDVEYKLQVQFRADESEGDYVLTKLGPATVEYLIEDYWTDNSDPEHPVDKVFQYLFITIDGLKYDHMLAYGYEGPVEDYDPSEAEMTGLDPGSIWYEDDGYIFLHEPNDSWVYIYEIGANNHVVPYEMFDHWNSEYVVLEGYGLGIFFTLNDQLYISFTEDGIDVNEVQNYGFYLAVPCELYELPDPDDDENTLNVLYYYMENEGHYYWLIADDHTLTSYVVDYVDYTIVNTNGYVFYQAEYPHHIDAKYWDGDAYFEFQETTYNESTQTWYCVYEDWAGNLQTLMYQVSPDNPAEVYQIFGDLVISGEYTWIDNPDDESTWEHYFMYVFDSGIVLYFFETEPEDPATVPYYYFDFGEYDEETHTLTMTDGYQYTYENGVFTVVPMI